MGWSGDGSSGGESGLEGAGGISGGGVHRVSFGGLREGGPIRGLSQYL